MVLGAEIAEAVVDLEVLVVHAVFASWDIVLVADVAGVEVPFGLGVALGRHDGFAVVDGGDGMSVNGCGNDGVVAGEEFEGLLVERAAVCGRRVGVDSFGPEEESVYGDEGDEGDAE